MYKHSCYICGDNFRSKYALQKHEWTHQPDECIGKCSCNYEYISKDDYEQHLAEEIHRTFTRKRRLEPLIEVQLQPTDIENVQFQLADDANTAEPINTLPESEFSAISTGSPSTILPKIIPQMRWESYVSTPSLLLHQWWHTNGSSLTSNGFESLCVLLSKSVEMYPNSKWPTSLNETEKLLNIPKDQLEEIVLQKGTIYKYKHFRSIIQRMFSDPEIYNNLHYKFVAQIPPTALWNGKCWKDVELIQQQICPQGKLFTIIGYSDKSRAFKSRKGTSIYPFAFCPAGVPRDIWKKLEHKYAYCFASTDIEPNQVLQQIVSELSELEYGSLFEDPSGQVHTLSVALLLWLGDHEENNKLAFLYPRSCRSCYSYLGKCYNRSKSDTNAWVDSVIKRFSQKELKNDCKLEAKHRGQHISYPALNDLNYFDVYNCMPACSGHSEDLGRTAKHLHWEIKDLSTKNKEILDQRIIVLCNYPGITFKSSESRLLSKMMTNETKLTATEYKSIRFIILFALIDLIVDEHLDVWLEHVEHATGYNVEFTTTREVLYWDQICQSYQHKMILYYNKHSEFTNPKSHDPRHDLTTLFDFGSFKNLDEMSFESIHQEFKHYVQHSNGRKLPEMLMKRELERHYLKQELKDANQFYSNFVEKESSKVPKTSYFLKKALSKEDWSNPALIWKQWLLEQALTRLLQKPCVLDSCVVQLYRTFKLNEEVSITASTSSLTHKERFDSVLLKQHANLNFLWGCVQQIFTVTWNSTIYTMALIQKYKFVDYSNPLHWKVGAPYITLENENNSAAPFIILPIEMIEQRVQVILDFRSEHRTDNNYWVNWWITSGAWSYPHQSRWSLMVQFKWRNV